MRLLKSLVWIACILTAFTACGREDKIFYTSEQPQIQLQKELESVTASDLETEDEHLEEFVIVDEGRLIVASENFAFSVEGNVIENDWGVKFGPEVHIPESPTDKIYTSPAFTLKVIKWRDFPNIKSAYKDEKALMSGPELLEINGLDVAAWEMGGMCSYTYYEIIGDNTNVQLMGEDCGKIDPVKNFEDLLNNVELLTYKEMVEMSNKHKIEQELKVGSSAWIGVQVSQNGEHDGWSFDDIGHYEIWLSNAEGVKLVDSFYKSSVFQDISWEQNSDGGINVWYYSGGTEGGRNANIIYDSEGEQLLRIERDTWKDFELYFQQQDEVYKTTLLIEEECSGEWPHSEEIDTPEVTLKGMKLEKGELLRERDSLFMANFKESKDFTFTDLGLVECVVYPPDGWLINPSMELLKFNGEGIRLGFSNGIEARISLKSDSFEFPMVEIEQ